MGSRLISSLQKQFKIGGRLNDDFDPHQIIGKSSAIETDVNYHSQDTLLHNTAYSHEPPKGG